MESIELILTILSVFLIADSILSMIFGKRYMLWGLNYTPAFYRALIERISRLPHLELFAVKLTELFIGMALFWIARALV